MDPPSPAPWSYAARAAYFGDRVCSFCQHHNPAGAHFCNGCGSPLHLKPCGQCDAVNHYAAKTCYRCGTEYATVSGPPNATPSLPAGDATAAPSTPDEVGVVQPPLARSALQAAWRALVSNRLLLLFIATTLIAGAYATHRIGTRQSDAMEVVAGQATRVGEYSAPTAPPAAPLPEESRPVEAETIAELQAPTPTISPEPPKRPGARQRPAADVHAQAGAIPQVKHHSGAVSGGSPVASSAKARQPDPWHAMHASLARCSGDLFDRIVCDQRVRQTFCEGHWGEAPECANGVTNDHGK